MNQYFIKTDRRTNCGTYVQATSIGAALNKFNEFNKKYPVWVRPPIYLIDEVIIKKIQ